MSTETQHTDADLLTTIIRSIVEFPDDVRVERTVDEQGVLLQLFIRKEDMGKIIGKTGKTAEAIRLILRVEGMKHGSRVSVRIPEPPVTHNDTRQTEEVVAA